MSFTFKTILVPLDFSISTDVAIHKAVEFADRQAAHLHLMHVAGRQEGAAGSKPRHQFSRYTAEQKMHQWKTSLQAAHPHISVESTLLSHGSIQHSIEDMARKTKADLIVIGKKSRHPWFPFLHTVLSTRLAEMTGSAVLTVKPASLHQKTKSLVVPISHPVTQRKMQAISALCAKRSMNVYLVAFSSEDFPAAKISATALLKVYQWLKDSLHCPAEYALLDGSNKAKAVVDYAERVNADVLLVQPGSETKAGWWNAQISDLLPSRSKMQVLAV